MIRDMLGLRARVLVEGEPGVVVARTREEQPVYDVMLADGRILKNQTRDALRLATADAQPNEAPMRAAS